MSIGIFDSGVGGLHIAKAIRSLLPCRSLIYFGDTLHLPYGEKNSAAIIDAALQASSFLKTLPLKFLLIACHTLSIIALEVFEKELPFPVIGMLSPSLKTLATIPGKKIAILSTKATYSSNYPEIIERHFPKKTFSFSYCSPFVPLVEKGMSSSKQAITTVKHSLSLLPQTDAIFLSCTHYPILTPILKKSTPLPLFDPTDSCAKQIAKMDRGTPLEENPSYTFYTSSNPKKFLKIAPSIFGAPIKKAHLIKQ